MCAGSPLCGFPLHPAGKPSDERARHLFDVRIPMLFLQGTRDALAETGLLLPLSERLGGSVTMRLIELADHSFSRSGPVGADGPAGDGRSAGRSGRLDDDGGKWYTMTNGLWPAALR